MYHFSLKSGNGARDLAQWVKALAVKSDDLSFISWTHMVEDNGLPWFSSDPTPQHIHTL